MDLDNPIGSRDVHRKLTGIYLITKFRNSFKSVILTGTALMFRQGTLYTRRRGWYSLCSRKTTMGLVDFEP